MKKFLFVGVLLMGLFLLAGSVYAASDAQPLTVNAAVNARAKLTLEVSTVNFPDADPDTTPSIAATENTVDVDVKVRTGSSSTATLTHLASDDLKSGSNTILIGNVTWTASGTGFVAGTMNKTTPQSAGSWTGSGQRTGTFSYFLANSWDYPGVASSYSASSTYTLTAP